ncbi:MAG TPA: flagellar export chaperone FlgN [Verrucomicrobiae bacterium]|jgi:flagellar biosynthesis/type III secretory pathway chaperone|nr:flagellar export chaperone FlgN [Verrucomicrobiae bacterium]
MIERIVTLIHALREELGEYGEMLALLDRQQQQVIARAADEVFQSIGLIKAQGLAIQHARARREQCLVHVAQSFEASNDSAFADVIPLMPSDYQPLVTALVEENNSLLVRVRQRARQNHLLLSRSMELMQNLINTLFPAQEMRVYNDQGSMNVRGMSARPLLEAVG